MSCVGPAVEPVATVEAQAPSREPDPLRPEAEPPGALPQHSRPALNKLDARRRSTSPSTRRGDERLGRAAPRRADVHRSCRRTFPSYSPYCPYTAGSTKRGTWTAPDLAKAKALVARSGTHGMKVTVWALSQANGDKPGTTGWASTGCREGAALARLPRGREAGRRRPILGVCRGDSRNRAQIGFDGWGGWGDPDPGVVPSELQLSSVPAGTPKTRTGPRFCDPGIDRQMRKRRRQRS